MQMISAGIDGQPWPEFVADRRPALVLPAALGRLILLDDGWADRHTALALAGPNEAWSAMLTQSHLAIHRPAGLPWFDGEIAATREWRRAVRDFKALLLITGPFTNLFEFPAAATAGQLFLLATPVRLEGDL